MFWRQRPPSESYCYLFLAVRLSTSVSSSVKWVISNGTHLTGCICVCVCGGELGRWMMDIEHSAQHLASKSAQQTAAITNMKPEVWSTTSQEGALGFASVRENRLLGGLPWAWGAGASLSALYRPTVCPQGLDHKSHSGSACPILHSLHTHKVYENI